MREENAEDNGRILMVEADIENGKHVSEWLLDQNTKLVWARSASEAMQLLNDVLFIGSELDGLLINQHVADASANRIVREFRHEFPWAPVAMMMGTDDISTSVWARARGIKIIRKPIQRNEIVLWLKHVKVTV